MRRLILVAFLAAACVAPAGAASCAVTAAPHGSGATRQITVSGSGFQDNDQVTIAGSDPRSALFPQELAATAAGTFQIELYAATDGQYVIGPTHGLACEAPAVILTLASPTAPPATPRATVPPTPTLTMPPTDTE